MGEPIVNPWYGVHPLTISKIFSSVAAWPINAKFYAKPPWHGVQRRMISVDNLFVFLRLLFFVLLLYVT